MALSLAGSFRYLRDTWRGGTSPHRVTWGLWAVEGILAFLVEVQQKVGLASLMTLMLGFIPCLVVAASFKNPQAVWKIDRIDIACGAVSVAGLIFWMAVNEPTVALVAFAAADFIAALPTYRKSWSTPSSETASAFVLGAANCALTIMTLRHFTTSGALFPGVILVTDSFLSLLILGKLGPRFTERSKARVSLS